jgi:O-antigen/teichoic acid export membrane protein
LTERPVDAGGVGYVPVSEGPSRARRLFVGWSANLFQMILGVAQQVALIPVFLHFWNSETLAAWLVVYAVGNLVPIADCGLQFRAINRFLAFKSSVDCDGRTARFFAALLRIYLGLSGFLVILVLVGTRFVSPSAALGFRAISDLDASFLVMTVGMLLTLPSNLVSGLYRARGHYGRAVNAQSIGMLLGQVLQLMAIVATGSLLSVTVAYVATQIAISIYFFAVDAPRLFPFLRGVRVKHSMQWVFGQFQNAAPFAVAGAAELALLNMPVLLVSALVSDRVAVAQWGLTRVVAGLLRALCIQTTLPLAAELGHDYAVGLQQRLRSLYARGSVFVTLLASVVVSGLLPFWPDFFALWTHGAVPYDPVLAITLLIGTGAVAPSILALGYANYSNRGNLLVRTKGLQLAVFLVLSVVLIQRIGPLGAAIAVIASDLLIQFGLLGIIILRQTLQRPFRHIAVLVMLMATITLCGWGLGTAIRSLLPWTGLLRFVAECALWLCIAGLVASPLVSARLRREWIAKIPN